MDWYFAQDGQRYGPVTEEAFGALVAQGRVLAQTLVWRAGLANWQTLEQTFPGAVASVPPVQADSYGYCAQCRRRSSTEDMIVYDGRWICAGCKMLFFQKLREGLSDTAIVPQANLAWAGFWIRAVAKLIDGVIIGTPIFLLGLVLYWTTQMPHNRMLQEFGTFLQFGAQAMVFVFWCVYETLMTGQWGATVGKLVCGLRVVRADGSPLTYARALGRSACASGALALVGCLGLVMFIIAAFDSQKRAAQDHICGTRVIYKGR